ncbi:MAG: hypothetical protein U1C59_11445 [Methylotenera sp.]|nr:hypothetical protein [Methylotenera sp.]
MSKIRLTDVVNHISARKYFTSAPHAFCLLEHTPEFAALKHEAEADSILPSEKLALLVAGLRDISTTADRITTGNVSHHRLSIKAIADKLSEILTADA